MVRSLLVGILALLPGIARAQGMAADPAAAAGALLLWLGLFGVCGLLLFWGLPIAVAFLIAQGRAEHPAPALLWAGFLGWIGVLVHLYRRAGKRCPHCHTSIIAETTLCYWCGGDTRPVPLTQILAAAPDLAAPYCQGGWRW